MALPVSDTICIFLRDHAVQLRVGLRDYEKEAPQKVIVNIEMEAKEAPRFDDPGEDNLDRVMDYSRLHHFVATELPKLGHIPLLETIAEKIVAFCFVDPLVAKVRVRLEKPGIKPDVVSMGIEMFRGRPAK